MAAEHTIFDRVLKILARNYPERFLDIALPGARVQVLGTLENVELLLPESRVDFVHRILDGDEEKLFHLEFQTRHEPNTARRMFIYSALLTRQFNLPVVSAVVYLRPTSQPIPRTYEVHVGGKVANRFEYIQVPLWEFTDDILAGRWPELAPLLVTLAQEARREEILERERELISQEEDARRRGELVACAITIASRFFDKEFLWRFFEEEVRTMLDLAIWEDIFGEELKKKLEEERQKALKEGIHQGLEQGFRKGLEHQLLGLVAYRFGVVPIEVEEKLHRLSTAQIEMLLETAMEVASLDEFVSRIPEVK